MDALITRCPHCNVAFQVTPHQLRVANGRVRCGACLEVFLGTHYLENVKQAQPEEAEQETTEAEAYLDPTSTDEPSDTTEPTPSSAPIPTYRYYTPTTIVTFDDGSAEVDQALTDDTAAEPSSEFETGTVASDPEAETDNSASAIAEATEYRTFDPATTAAPDNFILLGTDSPTGEIEEDLAQADSALTDATAATDPSVDTQHQTETENQIYSAPAQAGSSGEPGLEDYTTAEPDQGLQAPDPIPLLDDNLEEHDSPHQPATKQPWGRAAAVVLLGALGLAAGYAHFNSDPLASDPRWSQSVQQLCAMTGCELPSKAAPELITAQQLVVRSHPQYDNSLQISVVLNNAANFSQPFPRLALIFTDINGTVVAKRLFKPREYLSGEMAGRKEMPAQHSVQVAVDIVDPGAAANNYQLQVVP